jgi:hypothetical protein
VNADGEKSTLIVIGVVDERRETSEPPGWSRVGSVPMSSGCTCEKQRMLS